MIYDCNYTWKYIKIIFLIHAILCLFIPNIFLIYNYSYNYKNEKLSFVYNIYTIEINFLQELLRYEVT